MSERNIQWFPGHMARARRVLEEGLRLVDIVVEIVDARIPLSSQNPEIDRILKDKKRIIVCNKADLSDIAINKAFKAYFLNKGTKSIFTDSQKGQGVRQVLREIEEAMKEKTDRALARGRKKPIIRAMVVGIPNVGKSSFINRVTGRYSAVTGDRPGVTRNKQWLRINDNIHLLDTPGLLWPKFTDQDAAMKLACTGAIKDDILDVTGLSLYLIDYIVKYYPKNLEERFNFTIGEMERHEILDEVGKRRGCLIKGGEIDYLRASNITLDEFRSGKLGRISLDRPEDV